MAESVDSVSDLVKDTCLDDKSVDIKWTDDTMELIGLPDQSELPCVVKLCDSEGASPDDGVVPRGLKMYMGQPVLTWSRENRRLALARTIYHEPRGPYFEIGQTLEVPEDFNGWFEIVPPDFGRAQVYRSIGQIAESGTRKFFLRTSIRAIKMDAESVGTDVTDTSKPAEQMFKECKIKAGTVLNIVGSFAGKWQTTASTGLMKKKNKEWTTVEIKYLKCSKGDEDEYLIPYTTSGKFSIVYERGEKNVRTVYRMKDLLDDFEFPIKVRMVCGREPVVPCIFTGMLILKASRTQDALISSTVLNRRNVLFELPLNTKCDVKMALDKEDYCNMRTYIDAEILCRKYAKSFSSLIKLSPEMDTDQQTFQHIPTERKKRGESLKTLDLITNISTTDDEPREFFMESSDSDSLQSADNGPLGSGQMMELREITMPRTSQVISNA